MDTTMNTRFNTSWKNRGTSPTFPFSIRQGRFVMKLANNEILGTSGTIIWNGEDQTGKSQNLGVYVVLIEIFNTSGEVYHYKDGVVLTDVLK
jgi:hypothetical protein